MIPKAQIPEPCSENWETMRIGLHSRFCDNCKKDVVDFTKKSRQQILEYLLENHNRQVCGHIRPSQLDFSHSDFLITIHNLSKKTNNTNLSFYLLTMGALLLSGCNISDEIPDTDSLTTNTTQGDTAGTATSEQTKSNTKRNEQEIIMDGIICVSPDNYTISPESYCSSEPYAIVDTMPEFKGGIDSLKGFIQQNLKYPEWESKNKISGIVYVSFVVDKNGKIKTPKILKSVTGSKNFDTEVLRVVNKMPDWLPGRLNGKAVDVQFNLPISFKL